METTLLPKIISFPIALGGSIVLTLSIIDLANRLKLFDTNNHLKQHLEKVCSLGGIAIFAAFWISATLASGFNGVEVVSYLFAGSFILFLTGVKDDLIGIPALKRLFIQIGVASLMFIGGIRLTYLPGIEMDLPIWGSYILTITLIGTIVNAYNFIDGINGLAGGLATISSLSFVLLFYFTGLDKYAIMALALSGAISGFLFFNFGKAKIFMGDNGSTFIGVMLSFFTITFLQNVAENGSSMGMHPTLVLAILFIPVFDLAKVIAGRLVRGSSPFRGDRTHIHHIFLKAGIKQEIICYALYAWNILLVIASLIFLPQNFLLALLMLVLIGATPYVVLNNYQKIGEKKEQPNLRATNASDSI